MSKVESKIEESINLFRINLKPNTTELNRLLEFCLSDPKEQYVIIGWSGVYLDDEKVFDSYKDYYAAVRKSIKRMNRALNIFLDTKENDLFWTRDRKGHYWICRAKGGPISMCKKEFDIGAAVPVEAYLVGIDVPGGIRATFTIANGGTAQRIYDEKLHKYSKYVFNQVSQRDHYEKSIIENENIVENLPAFDLEELVISYIQIKHDYYILSNSIANRSTTPGIECILHSRIKNDSDKAVVQVKAGKNALNADDFVTYLDEGYRVFLYASNYSNMDQSQNVVFIKEQELIDFYYEYKVNLPKSISQWENLLSWIPSS